MKSFIIILFIVGICSFFIMILFRIKKNSYVRKLIKKYPIQVSALCRKTISSISKTDRALIFSFPYGNWEDWEIKMDALTSLSQQFPDVIASFILDYYPNVKNHPNYKKYSIFDKAQKRCRDLIECLQYEDILQISTIPVEEWVKRHDENVLAIEISLSNPDAIKEIKTKTPNTSNSFIIANKKRIEEIQARYNIALAFDNWIKDQNDFCTRFRNLRDQYAKGCGCYTYNVEFNKPLSSGRLIQATFKIWQIFNASFSPFLLEYQSPSRVSLYNKLKEFKLCSRYYNNEVYDRIINYIQALAENQSIVILFNNFTSYGWDLNSYNYHYTYISQKLDELDIPWIDVEDLSDEVNSLDCDVIFVLDFITTNSDLLYISKMIVESFASKIPTIAWYSLIKEFDEAEIREIHKEDLKKDAEQKTLIKEKTKCIDFIKSEISKINKHPFFSYYAITNTLIGEAANAEEVKSKWLPYPNKYMVKSIETSKMEKPEQTGTVRRSRLGHF